MMPKTCSGAAGMVFALLVALGVLVAGAGAARAAEPAEPEPAREPPEPELEPFGAGTLHVGGGVEFSWSQTSLEGQTQSALTTFTLDGEVGYFVLDGLKVAGLPFFTVNHRDGATSVAVGAALSLGYYYDLEVVAPFVRGRGGLLFGVLEVSEDGTAPATAFGGSEGELKGFLWGAGLGVALPVGNSVVELATEYLGTSLTVDAPSGSLEGLQHAVVVRLGYLVAL